MTNMLSEDSTEFYSQPNMDLNTAKITHRLWKAGKNSFNFIQRSHKLRGSGIYRFGIQGYIIQKVFQTDGIFKQSIVSYRLWNAQHWFFERMLTISQVKEIKGRLPWSTSVFRLYILRTVSSDEPVTCSVNVSGVKCCFTRKSVEKRCQRSLLLVNYAICDSDVHVASIVRISAAPLQSWWSSVVSVRTSVHILHNVQPFLVSVYSWFIRSWRRLSFMRVVLVACIWCWLQMSHGNDYCFPPQAFIIASE